MIPLSGTSRAYSSHWVCLIYSSYSPKYRGWLSVQVFAVPLTSVHGSLQTTLSRLSAGLMLRVTNPAHKRLSLSGFLFLRTIFIIQSTHKGIANRWGWTLSNRQQIAISFGSGGKSSFEHQNKFLIYELVMNISYHAQSFQLPHHRQYLFVSRRFV